MMGLSATRANNSGGFTLIEMSIVLVVIGLVLGGVLSFRQRKASAAGCSLQSPHYRRS
jgi:prepilin-type N-terminal cleavage/methylation domain-containing protein